VGTHVRNGLQMNHPPHARLVARWVEELQSYPVPLRGRTAPVDGVEAACGGAADGQEYGVGADAVAVHSGSGLQVIHKQQAQLGDHVHLRAKGWRQAASRAGGGRRHRGLGAAGSSVPSMATACHCMEAGGYRGAKQLHWMGGPP